MMETCVARSAHRVVFTVFMLVLNTVIAETFSTDTDTDNPLSTETYFTRTTGLKQTSPWPGREATATAVDLPSGPGEMTDIPASVSITGTRAGHSEKPLLISTNTADWATRMVSDESTEHLRSDKELTHNATAQWEGSSVASHSITNHQPVTETRTVRDVSVRDVDTTDSFSRTDITFTSTTNRVGERTLLSLISNSTSAYTEDSNSSAAGSLEQRTSGVTQDKEETVDASTVSDKTEPTFEDHNTTKATQGHSLETEQPTLSQGTESQTGQPGVTGKTTELVSDNDNPNSTTPLTVINRDVEETDVTSVSSGTSYTETGDSVSSIPPFTSGEHTNATSTSQQSRDSTVTYSVDTGASTEFSTRSVSSTGRGESERSPTHTVEETTIQDLTTAPRVLEDVATTVDDSDFLTSQPPFVSKTDDQTNTEVVPTSATPATQKTQVTEEATNKASTVYSSTNTFTTMPPLVTTRQLQTSTTPQALSEHTTIVTTDIVQVLRTTPSTTQRPPTSSTGVPQAPSTSDSADVTTLHIETSTATPGNTTAHGGRATTPYSKSTPTRTTVAVTTRNHTDRSTTEMGTTTTQMPFRSTASTGHVCDPKTCANGGHCVRSAEGSYHCQCLPAWTGPFCTKDVDECVNSPCPQGSVCVNTSGSFSCKCALGFDLEDGRSCTQVKTFLGNFTVNNSMYLGSSGLHELHREILQLLNASLSTFHGYRRSTLGKIDGEGVQISVVSMFSLSSNVTSADVNNSIQMSLRNCSRTYSLCTIKLQHQLSYHAGSLCLAQKTCDLQYSVCTDTSGIPYCECHPGYFKKNPGDMTCRDCGDGLKLVNGNCVECMFGFGGFNCNNFYKLIAVVVSPAGGALLLIVVIALIVTCCKKDKNDINKIIFKSGDLQMSPYAEFPKSNRVSMEWGRETIEMQENGSTKNLLQMTDIYYSPALRNADLERNGLYPFSGLPGSRHSCIYPAQWNPSFISDDSRRRDYF